MTLRRLEHDGSTWADLEALVDGLIVTTKRNRQVKLRRYIRCGLDVPTELIDAFVGLDRAFRIRADEFEVSTNNDVLAIAIERHVVLGLSDKLRREVDDREGTVHAGVSTIILVQVHLSKEIVDVQAKLAVGVSVAISLDRTNTRKHRGFQRGVASVCRQCTRL